MTSIRAFILECMPRRGDMRRKELTEAADIEGLSVNGVGQSAENLVERGLLVKTGPGLYRRPSNHEAKP